VGEPLRIGVTAPTEEEAVEQFRFAFNRWLEILSDTPVSGGT
jgi:hypothetical protein